MPSDAPVNRYLADAAFALIESLQDRLIDIRAGDYPTGTPLLLAEALEKLTASVKETLASPTDATTTQFCLVLLKRLGSHLRYLDAAGAEKVPWGLIRPMERLLTQIVPSSSTMVRARWSYNYSILELYDHYRDALRAFLPPSTLQEAFGDSTHKFFVVSLPLIERGNILLHVVLGHEIGHRIAESFFNSEDKTAVLTAVTTRIGDGKWHQPDIEARGPLFALQTRQWLTDRILKVRRRGLEEIISDMVGFYLFGPAFLFALNEFAYDDILDEVPSAEDYYPPWRYRYRECLKAFDDTASSQLEKFLGNEQPAPQVKTAYTAQINYLQAIANKDSDKKAIAGNPIVIRAYNEIESALQAIPDFIKIRLGSLIYDLDKAKSDFPLLLQRLAAGVPPNEGANGACDYRSALTIGWLVRLAKTPIPFDPNVPWKFEHDRILSQLVHKAIEYTEISHEYALWKARGGK